MAITSRYHHPHSPAKKANILVALSTKQIICTQHIITHHINYTLNHYQHYTTDSTMPIPHHSKYVIQLILSKSRVYWSMLTFNSCLGKHKRWSSEWRSGKTLRSLPLWMVFQRLLWDHSAERMRSLICRCSNRLRSRTWSLAHPLDRFLSSEINITGTINESNFEICCNGRISNRAIANILRPCCVVVCAYVVPAWEYHGCPCPMMRQELVTLS